MKLEDLPAGIVDWSSLPETSRLGETGSAAVRTATMGDVQMRLVTFSPGYVADHWCSKGHLVFVISGRVIIEQTDGQRYDVVAGMSYHVGDGKKLAHRLSSNDGAELLIVD